MSEWQQLSLGSLMEIIGGGTPKTSVSEYWGGDIPWLSVVDFNTGLKFVSSTEKTITQEGLNNSSTKLLNKGDIIISARGTVGVLAILDKPMTFNQSCYGIRSKKGISDTDYLYYLLTDTVRELTQISHGGVFDTITRATFDEIEVAVPPLPEQKAIASVLSSLDDKIDLLHRQNKTLEAMAETLFRQWFIEEAKEDWEEVKLGDLCEVITKGTTPKQFLESGVNFIKAESLTDTGSFIRSKFASVSTEIHDTFLKRSILQAGDLLFSIAGTIGRVAKVTADILPANTNQALAILRPKSHVNSDLIYCILKSSYFQELADGKVVHAVQPNLSLGEISNSCIRLPNQKVLQVFTEQVSAYFAKKSVNSSQIQTLENLRDTLLPKLMSGEVRVQYQTEEVA